MVAGPEMARVVTEFLEWIDKPGLVSDIRYHEDNPVAQATFLRHVGTVLSSNSEMGNPFMDPSRDLLILDTGVVAGCTIVESVQTIEKIGQHRCDSFYQDRLIARTKHLHDTMTKAKLPLFHRHVHTDKSRQQNQVKALKSYRTLFFILFIACQVQHTDMADFFSHEIQLYPPSLSNYGALRSGTKADILVCVSELVPHHHTVKPYEAHMGILDDAVIVNMIKLRTPVSFDAYIRQAMEYVRKQFRGDVQRMDTVFDAYWKDSLKAATRRKRGKAIRRHVEGNKQVPSKWQRVSACRQEQVRALSSHQ